MKTGEPKPWERFKLFPVPGKREHFICSVYDTAADMFDAANAIEHDELRPCKAACFKYVKVIEGTQVELPEMGHLFFCKEFLAPSYVAHEVFHAAAWWAKRKGVRLNARPAKGKKWRYDTDPEERMAQAIGNMMHQWYAAQARRVYFVAGERVTWKDMLRGGA